MNYHRNTKLEVQELISRILGNNDWIERDDLTQSLNIKKSQFYADITLLKDSCLPGFSYFPRDSYLDRESAEIMICFRWIVGRYRSRGQGVIHALPLLNEVRNVNKQQQQHPGDCIEVKSVAI
ncbi:hypothetical protein [Okeania sp. SIO2B3]|uniref:hypothetical protein n=1 Tax=Okeania sp. SIO2B3 TaxID=2607784 RepID=UPI0013C1F0E0|nr:hypothetical protein [Okeania sp. SIO2B3]NET40601.1 hypothetical protein [Okeania sp. SIO2B3]